MNRLVVAPTAASLMSSFASFTATALADNPAKGALFGVAAVAFGVAAFVKARQLRKEGGR